MTKKITINPFYVFFVLIMVIFGMYQFSWSKLFPPLSWQLNLFFILIMVALIFLGRYYNKIFPAGTFQKKGLEINRTFWTSLAFLSIAAEFVYERAIPIVEIVIFKSGYDYTSFSGIPFFHIFTVTLTSFLGAYLGDQFVLKRKVSDLVLCAIFVFYPLAIYNRGQFVMNLLTLFIVLLFRADGVKLSMTFIASVIFGSLIFLYLFGVFGNLRSESSTSTGNKYTDSTYIMDVGKATTEFRESSVPKPLFWAYMYLCSPIANLQNMVDKTTPTYSVSGFVTQSILPDFVGKRVDQALGIPQKKDDLITPEFNVSTVFANPFKNLGYLGMVLIFLYYVAVVLVYSYIMEKMYVPRLVGISLLFAITLFNMFSNMLVFPGLSFQLLFPFIFWGYNRIS